MSGPAQRVTLFRSHLQPGVQRSFPSFAAFVEAMALGTKRISDPDARPAWAPYTLADEAKGRRVIRHVGEYCQLVYDVDHANSALLHSVISKLTANRVEAFLYTTWSHWASAPEYRTRVVIPLEQPMGPIRYQATRRRGGAFFLSSEDDPNTNDLVRLYYGPCAKPNDPAPIYLYLPGNPLRPAILPNIDFVNRESLLKWASKLVKGNARDHMVGDALVNGLDKGGPLAIEGAYNEFCFNLGCLIARSPFPRADPKAIADILAPAWSRTKPDEPHYLLHTLERVMRDRIIRSDEQPSHMRNFWAGRGDPERTDPYMPSELSAIRNAYDGEQPPWIIESTDRRCHFLTHTGYTRAAHPNSASLTALHALAPSPVRLYDDDGAPLPWPVVLANPAVARTNVRVNYSLFRPKAEFVGTENTLTLCLCPLRDVGPPAPDPWFDSFLRVMAGPELGTVLTWLAWLPDTSTGLAGLFLHGARNSGKSLFAYICSRLWSTHGPTDLHRVLGGRFNEEIARNPFCWADESFPCDDRGNPRTEAYRAFVGNATMAVEAKNRDVATLIGYPRAYFSANDEDLLRLRGEYSSDAIKAIAERFVSVRVEDAARDMLLATDIRWLDSHVQSDAMTRHILWLAAQRPAGVGRFKVRPLSARGEQIMTVGSGITDGIFAAAWKYLSGRQALPGWSIVDGHVCVTSRELFDNWPVVSPQHPAPKSIHKLGRTLGSIATRKHAPDGKAWHYALDTAQLAFWCEAAGVAPTAEVEARIAKPRLATVHPIRPTGA